MHVFASYTWPNEASVDVHIDDEIDEYKPIRASELGGLVRDLLRNVVTDAEHHNAEHDKPAE